LYIILYYSVNLLILCSETVLEFIRKTKETLIRETFRTISTMAMGSWRMPTAHYTR
jgi:hypothetical protein